MALILDGKVARAALATRLKEKISALQKGEIPIYEPGLEEVLKSCRSRIEFTTDLDSAVNQTQVIFIAVGTPEKTDGSADLGPTMSVVDSICRIAQEGKTVVLKSTVPIGTGKMVANHFKQNCRHAIEVVNNPEFLKEGTAIMVEGAAGDFILPKGKQSFVFLTGGMGVTATRSMVLSEARRRSPRPMSVFYWTRTRRESPFLKRLENIDAMRYSFSPYITSSGGRQLEHFKKKLKNLRGCYFFVVGPPRFVVGMTEILDHANIPPIHIKAEEFSGYS